MRVLFREITRFLRCSIKTLNSYKTANRRSIDISKNGTIEESITYYSEIDLKMIKFVVDILVLSRR